MSKLTPTMRFGRPSASRQTSPRARQPDHAAVGRAHDPKFGFEQPFAAQGCLRRGLGCSPVVRMNEAPEDVSRHPHVARRAEDVVLLVRPEDLVAAEVPIPQADAARFLRQAKAFLALAQSRLGSRSLDGCPSAFGDVLDERDIAAGPRPRLGMMHEEHRAEPAALDERHGQDRPGRDGGVGRHGGGPRRPRVGRDIADRDGEPVLQLADDRWPEIVQAVTAGDARHRRVGPVPLDRHVFLRRVDFAVTDAAHLEMPAEKLGRPFHDRERVADHPDLVVEIEQERLPSLQRMKRILGICAPALRPSRARPPIRRRMGRGGLRVRHLGSSQAVGSEAEAISRDAERFTVESAARHDRESIPPRCQEAPGLAGIGGAVESRRVMPQKPSTALIAKA